jgi:Skp family chaperone for outer membrane proteins
LLLVSCLGLSSFAGFAAEKIGLINMQRIFEGYQRAKEGQEKLRKEFGPEETALEKTEIELRKYKDKLEVDPRPKTDLAFYQDFQRLQYLTLEHENRKRDVQRRAMEKQREEMKLLLVEVRNAVRAIAAAEGMTYVFRAPEWEDTMSGNVNPQFAAAAGEDKDAAGKASEPRSAQALVGLFRENPIIHFPPSADISAKVVKLLNDQYAAKK